MGRVVLSVAHGAHRGEARISPCRGHRRRAAGRGALWRGSPFKDAVMTFLTASAPCPAGAGSCFVRRFPWLPYIGGICSGVAVLRAMGARCCQSKYPRAEASERGTSRARSSDGWCWPGSQLRVGRRRGRVLAFAHTRPQPLPRCRAPARLGAAGCAGAPAFRVWCSSGPLAGKRSSIAPVLSDPVGDALCGQTELT